MIRQWTHDLAGTALCYREADIKDAAIDELECGNEAHAVEVAEFFKERGWTGKGSLGFEATRCLQFGTKDAIVGYAAIVKLAEHPHPKQKSHDRQAYLLVSQLAVESAFQGVDDPIGRRRYAAEIVDALMGLAKQTGCVGLCLNVRVENVRARRFYERMGFQPDGEYPSKRMNNARMARYRLIF